MPDTSYILEALTSPASTFAITKAISVEAQLPGWSGENRLDCRGSKSPCSSRSATVRHKPAKSASLWGGWGSQLRHDANRHN
jgi:hypothetical protein